jgi:hypothetical protein
VRAVATRAPSPGPRPASPPGRGDLAVAVLVAAGGLAALAVATPTAPLTGDGQHYVEFARSGLQHGAASAYHARRLLAPALVSLLPVDALVGYRALTLASLFVAALCLWAAALPLIGPAPWARRRALAVVPLFYGTWAVAPNLREYTLVDPPAWAVVAAIWWATVRQRWWVAAVLGVVGALTRETTLVAALAAAAAAWVAAPARAGVVRAVGVAGPALATVVALGVVLPGGGGGDLFDYLGSWLATGLGSLGPIRALYLAFVSYAALWLLVPRGLRALPPHPRAAAAVFLLAALALPFVGSPERMEETIFPAVVAAAVAATLDRPAWWLWAIALGNLLFVAHTGGAAGIPTAPAWLGLATALVLAVALYVPAPLAPRAAAGSAARARR